MNVKVQPSITTDQVGFNTISVAGCDDNDTSLTCTNGFYGPPVQPDMTVQIASPKTILTLYVSDLHGSPALCKMDQGNPPLTGSGSQQSNCGIRFPYPLKMSVMLMAICHTGFSGRN